MMRRSLVIRRLLGLLRPLTPLMAASSACRIINQGLGVAIPGVAAVLVVRIATEGSVARLVWMLAALALVKGLFRYLEQFTGHAVAFRLLSELRVDVYRNIEPLAPSGLEIDRSGDLVARVVGDVDRVEPFYAHTIAPLTSALVVPVLVAVGLGLWVDSVVALAFVPFPLLMTLGAPWMRSSYVARSSAEARRLSGEASAILTDAVQGSREIAVLDAGERIADRIDRTAAAGDEVRRGLARVAALRALLMDLLAGAAVVVVAWVAIDRFGDGSLDLAMTAGAVVTAWAGTAPARALEDIVPDLQQALAAARRLFDLADRVPGSAPRTSDQRPADGSVVFDALTVRVADHEALVDVGAAIPSGSLIAVVGPSGSGKSTLVETLLRFREPDSGSVRVGGVDVRDLPDGVLRRAVALVPQRPELFFGSIADNLRLARPGSSEAELWSVLERAALADWVRSLEHGLDSPVGELGETMSGGQRQRLTIARALLRDPEVLILDESTSELDLEAERRIWDALRDERGHRTVIVVAHRIGSVTDADEVLVLEGGRLIERGRHEDVLGRDGVYAALWQRHLDVVSET